MLKLQSTIKLKYCNLLTFYHRNGAITNFAGNLRITKMSPPYEYPQRSSGGQTLSSTTSEDLS